MKKAIIYLVIFILGMITGLLFYEPCDTNWDGKVTASDYIKVKKHILEKGDDERWLIVKQIGKITQAQIHQ